MTNIEKNQEQQNDVSALELQAKNLTPDQKKEVGTNVDVEKSLLDWRDTGAYKVLPPSYQEFIEDLKKIDYTPDNKYIQQIRAYIFAKEKMSVDIKDLKQSPDGFISDNSKTISLKNIYVDLSKSAILAYKQSNTWGIASAEQLPPDVTLGDMKLIANLNTVSQSKDYKDMMQDILKCRDDDWFVRSEYLASSTVFYKELQDEIVLKKENPSMQYPILQLFNKLLDNKLSIGDDLAQWSHRESSTWYVVPGIEDQTLMTIDHLTWHNISPAMQAYIKPILEALFPYHTYNLDPSHNIIRMIVSPKDVFQKLKDDRDTRYRKRIEESGVGVDNTYPVINNNFETLSTDKREALSLCLSNTSWLPWEVFAIQQDHNNKILKEMGIKTIQEPFGRMNILSKTENIYTPDQIKNWTMGEWSSDKALAELYSMINDSQRFGRLLKFEPSGTWYKLVQYNTWYWVWDTARKVNFLNRRIDKSGLHI
jgi:hypothetical protein